MLRQLIFLPLLLAFCGLIAWLLLKATGRASYPHEMWIAGIVCVISAEAAMMPGVFLQKSPQATVIQAGMAGTAGHMLLTVLLAAFAVWLTRVSTPAPLVGWMMVFFLSSLAAVATYWVRLIRATKPDSSGV